MSDRYRLTRQVASGGMAEVYLGVARGEEGFEKPVAIKRIHPHLSKNAAVVQMFLSEARLATHLHHQNIVEVLDVGRGADGLYIVMELVNGWDLAEVIQAASRQGRAVPPPLAAFIASQVLAGLSHAYKRVHQGRPILVAHRDVSPSNVLVSVEGEVKVADFGIAKLEAGSAGTEPGTFKGKLAYSAPELVSAKPASAASDQYALGVVLFELLTGKTPHGAPTDLAAYVALLQRADPPPLPGVPGELAAIVNRMLQRQPEARFPTPEALGRALAEFLAHAGVPTTSAELAAFLSLLPLPPPIAERPGTEIAPSAGFSLLGPTQPISLTTEVPGRTSPGSPPGTIPPAPARLSPGADLADFAMSGDWQPSGPTLDASGRLDRVAPPSVLPSPFAPTQLDVVAPPAPEPVAPVPPRARTGSDFRPPSGSLELARTVERPAETAPTLPPPEEPRRRSRWLGRAVMALATVLALGGFGVLLWPKLNGYLRLPLTASARPVLFFDSAPPGATVRINGRDLGATPLAIENLYPPREIDFQLILGGYRPYAGTFRGGEDARIEVNLRRR